MLILVTPGIIFLYINDTSSFENYLEEKESHTMSTLTNVIKYYNY